MGDSTYIHIIIIIVGAWKAEVSIPYGTELYKLDSHPLTVGDLLSQGSLSNVLIVRGYFVGLITK